MKNKQKNVASPNVGGKFVKLKRKRSDTDESPVKSTSNKKPRKNNDGDWFPGKFVLANNGSKATETPKEVNVKKSKEKVVKAEKRAKNTKEENLECSRKNQQHVKKQKKKSQKANGGGQNSSLLEKFYRSYSDSEDDEDFDEFEELSDDEEVEEEWETDTDWDEEMLSDEDDYYEEVDEEEDGYSYSSSDDSDSSITQDDGNSYDSEFDSDYVPEIEDKLIQKGEGVFYDAKGLDLAFGDSEEAQIIDIIDMNFPVVVDPTENIPKLIPVDGNPLEETVIDADDEDEMEILGNETEKLIKDLKIDDEDEKVVESSKLLQNVDFFNCIDEQGVVVILKGTIHFHGVLVVKAIINNVQVNGYELNEGSSISAVSISHTEYFLNLTPVIKHAEGLNVSEILQTNEISKVLSDDQLARLTNTFNPRCEVLVYLRQGFIDNQLKMLQFYSPHALLPSRKNILSNNCCQSSELLLSSKFFLANENKKLNAYQMNEQWKNIKLAPNAKIVITGGKNVGKSSLSQYLINSNIEEFKKILLIDLDIGQPICHAAQTISATVITKPMISSGYLDAETPEMSILYGDKNVMISPFRYVRCVRKLMEFCSSNPDLKNMPWIINTMGYQKGFGLQLISLLIRIFEPTDIVQIQHGIKSYNFSKIILDSVVNEMEFSFFDINDLMGIASQVQFTTHVVDSIVNNQNNDFNDRWISNASEKRKMSTISQLAKLLEGNQTSLNDVIPYKIATDKIRTVVMDEEFSHELHGYNLDLLNANLVYLCRNIESNLECSELFECFGVGLVRGIDRINQQIYILLPKNIKNIKISPSKINVLAICSIPLPAEILLKQSCNVNGKLPHVTCYKERFAGGNKYLNKRHIKDCF